MTINIQVPQKTVLKPTITVFGVGGAGGNAVGNMIQAGLEGVDFVVANTDAQAIEESPCQNHIQLGETITQGLGAGSYPEVGKAAAEESLDEIDEYLQGSNMAFITAGLGGGTGTGAAPVVARMARERGILTVGVVTKPFQFEGSHRMRVAELGLEELQKYVDTLIVIPNQNLFRIADKNTTFLDAFRMADDVLHAGVRGITDLMVMPGLINLDFSDVRSVMSEMGKAMMGTGEGEGESRAVEAAESAIANPLLDNVSMKGASGVLINVSGGPDMTLFEVDEAANRIREEVDPEANIIFGSTFDKNLEGRMRVSVVATGIDAELQEERPRPVRNFRSVSEQVQQVKQEGDGEENSADNVVTLSSVAVQESETVAEEIAAEVEDEEIAPSGRAPFIAPAPQQPKSQMDVPEIAESVVVPDEVVENVPPVTQPRSGGLFNSLFSRKAEAKEVPAAPVQEEGSVAEGDVQPSGSAEQKSVSSGKDDLEIPAFLRRKTS